MIPACRLLQERIFLTLSNYIFTAVFLAEMTVKVMGGSVLLWGSLVPGGWWLERLTPVGRQGWVPQGGGGDSDAAGVPRW